MKETFGSRGVRFDVYTQGDNKIFDIELQTANEGDLPKRARYYQGVIDVDNLPEGVDHKKLKDSYFCRARAQKATSRKTRSKDGRKTCRRAS